MMSEDAFLPNEIPAETEPSYSTGTTQAPQVVDQPQDPAPTPESKVSSESPAKASKWPAAPEAPDGDANYLSVIFRDGLDMSIAGLEIFVTLPSGEVCTATSTAQGAITLPLPATPKGQAKVEVKDLTGKKQAVCSIDLEKCKKVVTVRSPKVKVDMPLRPHQQALPPRPPEPAPKKISATAGITTPAQVDLHSPWWSANGAMEKAWSRLSDMLHLSSKPPESPPKTALSAKTLNNAGQPVTVVVASEGQNKDNLILGRNNVYRQIILDASKRLGLIPQALCALMDCEAAKLTETVPLLGPDGKQLKDKQGKLLVHSVQEVWDPNSNRIPPAPGKKSPVAKGLTQFIPGTWMDHVMKPGYYIHDKSVANGWVRQENIVKGKTTTKQWVFVLADGKFAIDVARNLKKWGGDANVKKCLDMRYDPAWSINAAADYGNENLKLLKSLKLKIDSLNGMDKAKIMYLMHHEGGGNGPLFIMNTLGTMKGGVDKLRAIFVQQFGPKGEHEVKLRVAKASGDVEFAYRKWLADYIDSKFRESGKYFYSSPIPVRGLSELIELIGGKAVE